MKAIELTSRAGVVYAYACGRCHQVPTGSQVVGPQTGPIADLVEESRREADRCCLCDGCHLPSDDMFARLCPRCREERERELEPIRARAAEREKLDDAETEATLAKALDRDAAPVANDIAAELDALVKP